MVSLAQQLSDRPRALSCRAKLRGSFPCLLSLSLSCVVHQPWIDLGGKSTIALDNSTISPDPTALQAVCLCCTMHLTFTPPWQVPACHSLNISVDATMPFGLNPADSQALVHRSVWLDLCIFFPSILECRSNINTRIVFTENSYLLHTSTPDLHQSRQMASRAQMYCRNLV